MESRYSILTAEQQHNYDQQRERELWKVKSELNALLAQKAEFLAHRARQTEYLNGNNPSFVLNMKIQNNEQKADITLIKNEDGVLLNDPVEINQEFKHFYQKLYSSEAQFSKNDLDSFFADLDLPKLTEQQTRLIDSLFTLTEIYDALKEMKHGKSPGLDGIPPELYLTFWDELGPLLLEMFQQAIMKGSFNRDISTAIISLLQKKGKDGTICANYRPLSLLNGDLKLYAKVLARRLETTLPTLVHPDQTGFVKQRFASDNLRRLLHIIDRAPKTSTCAVLSLDAEKAFDRLEWEYLWYTMKTMAFGDTFINMLKVLYHNPTAIVITSNQCSTPFPIGRSVRQGCPASALLFAISLEPLAQKIRNSSEIKPISINNTHHNISLYADDLLLFLDNTPQSLPAALNIIQKFSFISGYKINLNKSILLPLNTEPNNSQMDTETPVGSCFRYLGIDIYPSIDKIVSKNYKSLKKVIKDELHRWSLLQISLSARLSVVKTHILPKINFLVSMIHLPPPLGLWEKLQSLVFKFTWREQHPRISNLTLQNSRNAGGLSFPNFERYYFSFMLRPLMRWFNNDVDVPWVNMEKHIVSPYTFKDIIFSGLSPNFCQTKFGPIIAHSIYVWTHIAKMGQWDTKWHLDTPIFDNFHLLVGKKTVRFPNWQNQGIHKLSDIYSEYGLRSFEELKQMYNIPGTYFFFYLQLRTAMRTYGVPWNQPLIAHPLLRILNGINVKTGFVSGLYNKLQEK